MFPVLVVPVLLASFADGPVDYGRAQLDAALAAAHLEGRAKDVAISVDQSGTPESFAIDVAGGEHGAIAIHGADLNGAMYGALELAERVRMRGADALSRRASSATPFLADRGLNLFLTLPWDVENAKTNLDDAALSDPQRWWFANDGYWRMLFDLMADARLNWLDLHGTYDIESTRFPNLYAYFVESDRFPAVGPSKEAKAKNLAQLAHVIDLAHARGIKVSLMSYEAVLYTPHRPKPPYDDNEQNNFDYTKEVVEKLVRALPQLDKIGYRIGESGHSGEFFKCYGEAIAASGRDIPLYTRSWVTRKAKVVPLARQASDFTVEIKYNGEQWGAPWIIMGGRMAGWGSYSFEDYLSDSSVYGGNEPTKTMWPGNPIDAEHGGGQWPSEPYKIVWQVRANGTHRIFAFHAPDLVRRSIQCMKLGTASGYTVEPPTAYYPATPDSYIADPKNRWCEWTMQRDAMFVLEWGRLGYDPATDDAVFESEVRRRYGDEVAAMSDAWKAASHVITTAFTARAFGPDHRDHAPELETGGSVEDWVDTEPLDTFVSVGVREALAEAATNASDGRRNGGSPEDRLRTFAAAARTGLDKSSTSGAAVEIHDTLAMLAFRADYDAARMRTAALAAARPEDTASQSREIRSALDAWNQLSHSTAAGFWRPFPERLRMGTTRFHWANLLDSVPRAAIEPKEEGAQLLCGIGTRPPDARLAWSVDGNDVVVSIPAADLDRAWVLEKPLPSATYFHRSAMIHDGDRFVTRMRRRGCGHAIAADIDVKGGVCRLLDDTKETPYLVIPSLPGPTPPIYSSQEALAHLDPHTLSPAKHGLLLISTRAWDFHRHFDVATQRKVLDAVARGMTLLVLQQDYTSGRYPLNWLLDPPKVENNPTTTFDPGDASAALGLEKIETDAILWQPFAPTPGWEVFGNGGLAKKTFGNGTIWMCQARLLQRMHIPSAAKDLLALLRLGGVDKPVVILDAGSEGNRFVTSVIPDFLNAHDIPFATLGEVIADEQPGDITKVIPGAPWDDHVLDGDGHSMVNAWLEAKVKSAAARPIPKSKDDLLAARPAQRTELLRGLGLDPEPERTPLNARVTGTIAKDGYRIEKLVYESRPGFTVTAHLYVPDAAHGNDGHPLPVIVNPHGHWAHKKLEPVVQLRAIQQALHGFLALVVDSPGFSFEGNTKIERREAGTHDDAKLVMGSWNATAAYVWDLSRGLDYLATRPEADMTKIGITGTSGGGLATVYAFAADERYTCAVPVCYPVSLEIAPHNGCLCNHVPGTLQVGDRADVLALRAPLPVMLIGADQDREFPPEGTRKSAEKLKALWSLFGAGDAVDSAIFHSGHDYNQDMRETALGFFTKHLQHAGDGGRIAELPCAPLAADAPEGFCLTEPPAVPKTMRDFARANVERDVGRDGTFDDLVRLAGGLPARVDLDVRSADGHTAGRRYVTFAAENGLRIPGVLAMPEIATTPRGAVVLVADGGKRSALERFPVADLVASGIACFAIDARGTGELSGIDQRLAIYLGASVPLWMGFDAARAAEVLRSMGIAKVVVLGDGACGAQAALFAASIDPTLAGVAGLGGLERWTDAFEDGVSALAILPRADHAPSLERLRSLVTAPALWTFAGKADGADVSEFVLRAIGR